jgi:hypothetical protein
MFFSFNFNVKEKVILLSNEIPELKLLNYEKTFTYNFPDWRNFF